MCFLVGSFEKLDQLSKYRRVCKVRRAIEIVEFEDFSLGHHKELADFFLFDLPMTVVDDVKEGSSFGEGVLCLKLFQHFLLSNYNYSLPLNKSQHLQMAHIQVLTLAYLGNPQMKYQGSCDLLSYYYKMDQQLLESVVDIVPANMEDLLARIQAILASSAVEDQQVLDNIVKSLFYGLWNFDKMINQHNLSTRISELLIKLPKKNSIIFFRRLLTYLHEKWSLIDHHRINKFMQLVRYLLSQAFKTCEKHKLSKKKIDDILLEKVYNYTDQRSGLVFHITDIYFEVCDQSPQGASLQELQMFEQIMTSHPNEALRLYVAEHIYEKYKAKLVDQHQEDLPKLEEQLLCFSQHFLELAKKEEKELHRKNLYTLVGYAKSPQLSFQQYLQEKKQKQLAEQQKKKKTMSKFKKQQIKKMKEKRKQKPKGNKTKKIMSVRKFEDKNRMKKGIQQL